MRQPQILAPPEKLRRLAELRERHRQIEAERLKSLDIFSLIGYEPTPKQQVFHGATEHSVLFGGSTGGGKSRALTAEAIRACVRYPGLRVGAFRRSYPELRESLLAELAKLEYAGPLGARWNGTEHELRFSNGSLIMFRYAETLPDATRRQGGEYQLLILDELTLFPPDVVAFLESRVRSGRADIPVIGVRASANPGGPGHSAVKDRYIEPTRYGAEVITDERGRTVRFVPSKLSDNPHMNPEHAADLMALSGQMREAFLEGNWNIFAGQMYPELNRDRHVVDPFTLPATWARYCGIDWGYFPSYWAVVWAAADEDGRVWVYREAYEQMVGEADQAKRILAAEAPGERIAVRYADDAMFATRGDAKPISDVYTENGVPLTAASKGARVTGWERVRSYLAEMPACPHHRANGWDTCPRLHIFAGCENLFKHLGNLSHATKGDPEDAGPNPHDHLPDALRYLLINLGGGPEFTVFGEEKVNPIAAEIEKLQPVAAFGYRPYDDDLPWDGDYEDQAARIVRTVRTAEDGRILDCRQRLLSFRLDRKVGPHRVRAGMPAPNGMHGTATQCLHRHSWRHSVMHEENLFPDLIPLNTRRVYFGLGENGLIKIGVTSRKSGRRGGEMHFTEMCAVPGGRNVENHYHMKYAAERVGRTEWFNASDRLVLDLIEMCAQQRIEWACAVLKALLLRRKHRDAA